MRTLDPLIDDIFVPASMLLDSRSIDSDEVKVTFVRDLVKKKTTAISLTRLSRSRTRVFGVATDGLLSPDPYLANFPIHLLRPFPSHSTSVLAELLPEGNARVIAEFGPPLSPRAIYARVMERTRLAEVVDNTTDLSSSQPPTLETPIVRKDLTSLYTFTIDGPDSRDLDDAISAELAPDGSYLLYVHIADVASKVRLGSPVDLAARAVATSVYLPGYSIPMLPPHLSYDSCSLLEATPRDTLTVVMAVSLDGEITSTELYASSIISNARLTYSEVATHLNTPALSSLSPTTASVIDMTHHIASLLAHRRALRGGLRASEVEMLDELYVTESGPALVPTDNADIAHDLVEEAMVAANEAVASWLIDNSLPGLFRLHPAPSPEASKIVRAYATLNKIAVDVPDQLTPLAVSKIDQCFKAANKPPETLFSLIADSLGHASYSQLPGPHFGLASLGYVHFTSPIRRYADLTVHRIIHAHLAGSTYNASELGALADHINQATSRAAITEAGARSLFTSQILYQRRKLTHSARISRLSERGMMVRLTAFNALGWVSAKSLTKNGRYPYELSSDGLTLKVGHLTYSLTQAVQVRPYKVDTVSSQVDFDLVV